VDFQIALFHALSFSISKFPTMKTATLLSSLFLLLASTYCGVTAEDGRHFEQPEDENVGGNGLNYYRPSPAPTIVDEVIEAPSPSVGDDEDGGDDGLQGGGPPTGSEDGTFGPGAATAVAVGGALLLGAAIMVGRRRMVNEARADSAAVEGDSNV
jgi:hypothetical protein